LRTTSGTPSISSLTDVINTTASTHDGLTDTTSQTSATTTPKTIRDSTAVHSSVRATPTATRTDVAVKDRTNLFDFKVQRGVLLLRVEPVDFVLHNGPPLFGAKRVQGTCCRGRRTVQRLGSNVASHIAATHRLMTGAIANDHISGQHLDDLLKNVRWNERLNNL
jgi:hypothetical protein